MRWQKVRILFRMMMAMVIQAGLCLPALADVSADAFQVLKKACFECHGESRQKGKLRLDTQEHFQRGGASGKLVDSSNPNASELLRRVMLPKADEERMPPRGEPLKPAEVALLREWILGGAKWPGKNMHARHWAYETPKIAALPKLHDPSWPKNEIDHFVLARLEKEGFKPSPAADGATLVRRVYLDLVGLPPTPAEAEAFLKDKDPQAYEKLVDRLLASNQFGVKWARPWLDYARYADSHGFQRDDFRDLWAWRDWVVRALNNDMPFDQFSIEQLAGDLLPNPTLDQRIATGFNRNAPTNVEAGSDPEETRVNQVFDRVNTLGMVWLGTTLECAQCHDHKYDPFTQKDYYGLFAFFNNTELEADRANPRVPGSIRFQGPSVKLNMTKSYSKEISDLQNELQERKKALSGFDESWEKKVLSQAAKGSGTVVLPISDFESQGGATHEILSDHSVLLSGDAPDKDTYTIRVQTKLQGIRGFKLEALTDDSLPGKGPGRGDANRPNFVLNTLEVHQVSNGVKGEKIRLVKAKADFSQKNFDVAGAIDENPATAWAINPKFHEPHWAVFETDRALGSEKGMELQFTLVQNYGSARTIGRLRLNAILGEADPTAIPPDLVNILKIPFAGRNASQHEQVTNYRAQSDATCISLQVKINKLESGKDSNNATSQVMVEMAKPRTTSMLTRGDFRNPAQKVDPATPVALHPLEQAGSVPNRLTLARWLVSRENPLVARVVVNRWWDEIFGNGLVNTPEDFGTQGERPTHPELLDFLATKFMDQGWSMKKTIRSMVLSNTYRQSSRVTPDLLAKDDRNLLLARGPRFRLDAELVRDNALAVAGLLNTRLGGPPVKPYQPDGLWVKVGGARYDYIVSDGDEKFRRGLYVVLKRSAPYPSFVNFDANSRFSCRVKRMRSNTPLQALTLLNDPVYVEAARAFAKRILDETSGQDVFRRVQHAFKIGLVREPDSQEVTMLANLYESRRKSPSQESEFNAAWAIATVIMNLDEFINKE